MHRLYEVTVPSGADIKQTIVEFVIEHGWENVWISGAIGSVCETMFTTPVENELPLVTANTPCHGAAELLSMVGEVMSRDRMDPALKGVYKDVSCPLFVHLHASCATAGGHVIGGGLAGGKAFRSVRIFMTPLET